jgi:MFS family permease
MAFKSKEINNVIEFKKSEIQHIQPYESTNLADKQINKYKLPLTAHNRKDQMSFLRKLYIAVIIQTIVTSIILIFANFLEEFKDWLTLPNRGITCFGVGMGIVVTISLITTFAPYRVRNFYISLSFLSVFGVCLGFIVCGLGSSIYMLTEYGNFIIFLIVLFVYTFYVEIEFLFWRNYLIGFSISVVYLIIIDGVLLANWLAFGCLLAGSLFFNFYAIMFSQFIIARNAEMFRIGDYIFGALKFNVDMGDILMKITLDYVTPIIDKWRKKPIIINKDTILKNQQTFEKDQKIHAFTPIETPLADNVGESGKKKDSKILNM